MTDFSYGYPPPGPPPPGPGPGGYGMRPPLASWGQRVVATLIDGLIIIAGFIVLFIVSVILGLIARPLAVVVLILGYLVLFLVSWYFAYLTGSTGQSPGKRLTGLMVIDEQTGRPIGGWAGVGRQILHILDSLVCYIGYLFPIWDAKRQTFADKILHTVVLADAPRQRFGAELFR